MRPWMVTYQMFVLVCSSVLTVSAAEKVDSAALLEAHNKVRQEVGVEGLKWSAELEKIAETYAQKAEKDNNCFGLGHNPNRGDHIGENLAGKASSPKAPQLTPADAMQGWANEKKQYTYETNSCAAGKVCGHYTQVVWRNTTEVGCAIAVCSNNPKPGWFAKLMICNYRPAGNVGKQKPY